LRAIGTTTVVAVTEPAVADRAALIVRDELSAIDATCSRFRADAEIAAVNDAHGSTVAVSALLFQAILTACDVAELTKGAVDPTVGAAVESLGYDRDFDLLGDRELDLVDDARDDTKMSTPPPMMPPVAVPGWWRVELDVRRRTVRVPSGTRLDLGASAKALVADRAAMRIADALPTGALVSVGGDVAVAGPAPSDGWAIGIAQDSATSPEHVDQVVSVTAGGLASSSTGVRTWHQDGRRVHHIVDPTTGECAEAYWTLVSATGRNCVEANAATTAAIVWGRGAVARLNAMGRCARLVRADGRVLRLNGWPAGVPGATGPHPAVTT
jgi:thiamine biosynthesis lipoprotein